jgi:chemotaxis protein CheD
MTLFRQKREDQAGMAPFNPASLPKDSVLATPGEVKEGYTKHYLIPGKIFVARKQHAITTILGSGIAICLWDPTTGIGGANHFLLPDGPAVDANATRYASSANAQLLREMIALGANPNKLEARVVGGSQPAVLFGATTETLGDKNLNAANHFLHMNGIVIKEHQVGGTRGRRLVFYTDTGIAETQQL